MAAGLGDRILSVFARVTSALAPWHKWPFLIAMPTLAGIRVIMRERNLFNTETAAANSRRRRRAASRDRRTADGSFNSLGSSLDGHGGRAFRPQRADQGNLRSGSERPCTNPNPRRISNELLARREFVPVPYLNVLVSGVAAVHGA